MMSKGIWNSFSETLSVHSVFNNLPRAEWRAQLWMYAHLLLATHIHCSQPSEEGAPQISFENHPFPIPCHMYSGEVTHCSSHKTGSKVDQHRQNTLFLWRWGGFQDRHMIQFELVKMTDPQDLVSTTRKEQAFPSAGAILEGEVCQPHSSLTTQSKALKCSKRDASTVEGRPGEQGKPGLW